MRGIFWSMFGPAVVNTEVRDHIVMARRVHRQASDTSKMVLSSNISHHCVDYNSILLERLRLYTEPQFGRVCISEGRRCGDCHEPRLYPQFRRWMHICHT
jgi:hypothetical protein